MTDIILIQPPIEDFYFTYKRSIPYGLASIAASLQKSGFSVEIIDCLGVKKSKIIKMPEEMNYLMPYYGKEDISIFSLFHEFRHYGYSYEHAAKITADKKPFLVGISSLFTPYCDSAEKTAQAVKKFLPNCKIVMGGHHPTVLPEEVMKCFFVDFVLRGEGEISMPVLAESVKRGTINIENVPGIVFRKSAATTKSSIKDDSLHISEPAWIENFDNLPLPAMELVNHNFYSRNKQGSTVVAAGRGCPMPCTYCSVGALSSHGKFRLRKVEDVVNELKFQIEKYDIGFIDFEDENLTLNKKWFLELMEEIVKLKKNNKLIELRAMNGLFPPSLDQEMIAAMKDAGFKTLNLSLCSTSLEQLKRFKRADVRKSFEEILLLAEKYSMDTVSYIIAGAPEQSAKESLDDLIFLAQKNTIVGLSIFYPAPGSVDYNKCLQNGILPKKFSLMRSSALPISHTTTRLEAVTLLRLARVINFIKSLIKENEPVPKPEEYDSTIINLNLFLNPHDQNNYRKSAGITLLKWFLHDGVLRGVDRDGTIFEHNTDRKICKQFVEFIRTR